MWPSSCTSGHLSQRNEDLCSHETSTQMFMATSFILVPNRKQFRCPPAGEWSNRPQCLHTVEYCSVTERNKLVTHPPWINLQRIMQSGSSQSQRLYLEWSRSCNILEMIKLQKWKADRCSLVAMRERGLRESMAVNGAVEEACRMEMFPILLSLSVPWLWYCCYKMPPSGKLGWSLCHCIITVTILLLY